MKLDYKIYHQYFFQYHDFQELELNSETHGRYRQLCNRFHNLAQTSMSNKDDRGEGSSTPYHYHR